MSRTVKSIIGVVLVLVIFFSAIIISQNLDKPMKIDVTERRLYTLSDGTKNIIEKINQPITLKLYYAKTASLKAPDEIRFFENYYNYVKALLEEYESVSKGMIALEIIDPRPYSPEEVEALRFGLDRAPITEEESFFFGLGLRTQFGVEKAIPFFNPSRQNFVEYDLTSLIDSAITRQKTRVGVLSSLPIVGDDVNGYMAQMMRMQGQQPKAAWGIVEQLKQKYEVIQVPADAQKIEDVDILLIVHPKDLGEPTLFAIDQYILNGGRAVICVDPHCFADQPEQSQMMQYQQPPSQASDLNVLLKQWGLEMTPSEFAGDLNIAIKAPIMRNQRPETVIGFLDLSQENFNTDSVITADLNQVRYLFAGVLKQTGDPDSEYFRSLTRTPLVMTTDKGNSIKISSPYEMQMLNPQALLQKYTQGTEPVEMAYLVTGKFKSAFPDGIDVEVQKEEGADPNAAPEVRHLDGIKEAQQDCAVAIFTDVDFISDQLAYQSTFFGGKAAVGDNSALLINAVDDLGGSSDLISIRSRGNFRRPFAVVEKIEREEEAKTAEEEERINAEIKGFEDELRQILSTAKEGDDAIVGTQIIEKKRELERKIREAQARLNQVKLERRERIEQLGNTLRGFNMLAAPAAILLVAIILGIRRSVRKRHYISHASDS